MIVCVPAVSVAWTTQPPDLFLILTLIARLPTSPLVCLRGRTRGLQGWRYRLPTPGSCTLRYWLPPTATPTTCLSSLS